MWKPPRVRWICLGVRDDHNNHDRRAVDNDRGATVSVFRAVGRYLRAGKAAGQKETPMKERPIIFNGEMVRAILDGRKTQTRRVMKPQPAPVTVHRDCLPHYSYLGDRFHSIVWHTPKADGGVYADCDESSPWKCPYGQPGDVLWVRETWAHVPRTAYGSLGMQDPTDEDMSSIYRATFDRSPPGTGWKPSIHMPRWASRITLEITDVRVQKLKAISDADCRAEGIREWVVTGPDQDGRSYKDYHTPFKEAWDSINAKRGYSWDSNPWVWVIQFEKSTRVDHNGSEGGSSEK